MNWRSAYIPLMLLVLVSLACGSFAPRPTPVPPPPTPTPLVEIGEQAATPTFTPTLVLPTSVPTRAVPTATFTPTPVPGTAIIVDQPARVVAPQGLNVRRTPSVEGDRLGRFAPGLRVTVLEGPVDADGYRWWRVGTNQLSGWVAEGDDTEEWLSPQLGDERPVNRPVRLGDEVTVTVETGSILKIRTQPGLSGLVERSVPADTRFSIVEGPVDADGFRWWRISGDDNISGWAAEGNADERWLTPLE